MSAIAFVGDSFCASYNRAEWQQRRSPPNQFGSDCPTYLDIVTKNNNYTLYPFGYGGKSWWFSRYRFIEELERIPAAIFSDQLETIVFCHTNPDRINNGWNIQLNNTDTISPDIQHFYRYLFDSDFNDWAQQQWFREISLRWSNIKTIHLHCFPKTIEWSHLLPGMVFTLPLIHVSIGELEGTDSEIDKQIFKDTRFNHLSEHNNKVLAEWISGAIYDYRPGHYDISLNNFKCINPNAQRWPSKGYGTR